MSSIEHHLFIIDKQLQILTNIRRRGASLRKND
jgi:hypothetical protein